jgi:CubicO group peptidase (beta-lactamase class C family)
MESTDLVPSEAARARLATGYDLRSGGPEPHPGYEVVTAGGAAACATPRDMARYLAALLGGGGNEHGSVLARRSGSSRARISYSATSAK